MELPPPTCSFGHEATAGRKPTHDFLSLRTTSSHSQDPRPSPGNFLKTQNFLQPLERVGTAGPKEGDPATVRVKDKTPQSATSHSTPSSVEHVLPGGIGTYTISHISYPNQVPKPEVSIFTAAQASSNEINDDNSNSSSPAGCGFTLWEECAVNKGKTGKENDRDRRSLLREPASNLRQWSAERRIRSSFNKCGSFSHASSLQVPAQTNRSFVDLMVSTKKTREDHEDCEVDFFIKKEGSPSDREDFTIRSEGKIAERKANTPRSKHSATEQRRRSKINNRFQMLREIIPHSDQKRDKASFLLEAIEYIQYLQEKVHTYEKSFPGWNHESAKQMPLSNNHQPREGFVDHHGLIHGGPGAIPILSTSSSDKIIETTSAVYPVVQRQGESNIINPIAFKINDQRAEPANKIVVSPNPSQPKTFPESIGISHFAPRLVTDTETTTSQHSQQKDDGPQKIENASPDDDVQGVAIEDGTINISNAYSQGFLNTLTQALQGLGVDLSKSRISVQIDLGKQNKIKLGRACTMRRIKDDKMNTSTTQVKVPLSDDYSDQLAKRLKSGNHL